MEVRIQILVVKNKITNCFLSHTPTNVDLNKLQKIERTLLKLDRLIGKGAFGSLII